MGYKFTQPQSEKYIKDNHSAHPALDSIFDFLKHSAELFSNNFAILSLFLLISIGLPIWCAVIFPQYNWLFIFIALISITGISALFIASYGSYVLRKIVDEGRAKRRRDIYSLSSFCVDSLNELQSEVKSKFEQKEFLRLKNITENLLSKNSLLEKKIENLELLVKDSASQNCNFEKQIAELRSSISALQNLNEKEFDDTHIKFDKWLRESEKISLDVNANSGKILEFENKLKRASNLNSVDLQAFDRTINDEGFANLQNDWCGAVGAKLTNRELAYMAHKICILENRSIGRFATHVQDIVGRLVVTRSLDKEDIHILEIGSLFGIALFSMYNGCVRNFKNVHITSIDLLDGYYGGGSADILTGEPISEEVLKQNQEIARVPDKDFTIIKGSSFDAEIISKASSREIDVLIVDGDHSYDGIAQDVKNYSPFVSKGGLIVIDDYNNPSWPDVDKFIDENMRGNESYELVAQGYKTAIFRKV